MTWLKLYCVLFYINGSQDNTSCRSNYYPQYSSGELPDTFFLKDKTHLNAFGTRKLLQNINNQCRVTRSSEPQKAPRISRQHTLPAAVRGYKPYGYKPQVNYCHICSMNNHSTNNCRFNGRNNEMSGRAMQ